MPPFFPHSIARLYLQVLQGYESAPITAELGATGATNDLQCCYCHESDPDPAELDAASDTSDLQGYCYCYESAPALAGRGSATSATYGCYYGSTDAGYDRDYCRPPDLERPRRAALGGASPLVLHTQD